MAAKTDFKSLDAYKARSGAFRILEVPTMQYLMVDGHGDPNTSPEYSAAIESLFPVAYALKFASKNEFGRDYVVMPLEALWWAEDMASFTEARDKSQWSWTAMIMVPEWTTQASVDAAVAKAAAKKADLQLDRLRFATLDEGTCVQTLHIGPYDDEAATLASMHDDFIPANGLTMTGKHHEIYLSDARRVEPSRLRTILRQPVLPA